MIVTHPVGVQFLIPTDNALRACYAQSVGKEIFIAPTQDRLRMLMAHPPRRIAIVRALQLGDLLVAIPAFRALRRRYPQAEITLIGLPWAASFVQRYRQYIDRFVEFGGYPGIQEVAVDAERTARFIEEQRAYGYDLVVQMHGSGTASNPLALVLGGKVTAGYYSGKPPAGLTLGAVYPEHGHEIYRNLGLAALLGCQELDVHLEFPLYEEDYVEAMHLLNGTTDNHKGPHRPCQPAPVPTVCDGRLWIGMHPGARPPARRWPVEYFAAIGDELAQRFGAQVLLTGGPSEEATVQAVAERMSMPTVNVAGKTSLGGLAALISKLDLFISNDSGPAHLACAVDTPSITLFGPADYERWAPLDQAHHLTARHPVECSPCGFWDCPIDHRCLRWLRPERVFTLAQQLLQRTSIRDRSSCDT